jgi:hypothetical protein
MHYRIFLTLSIAVVLCSCSGGFSKGVKKDLSTGLSASYNGFSIEDIYLVSAEHRLTGNAIAMGSKVSITATGVENFMEKDGKVFPGCTILLTDKSGKEILNLPDAFSDMVNGTTVAESKILQASVTTGDPMIAGETYHLQTRFFDKNKKESEIVASVDLVMK